MGSIYSNNFTTVRDATKPTFFGRNSSNTSHAAPLIVCPTIHIGSCPTSPPFSMTLEDSERDAMISNGWAIVTQMNGTRDVEWPSCVSCAVLHLSLERTRTMIPDQCKQCFERYCWNGTLDEQPPANVYEPHMYGPAMEVDGRSSTARPPLWEPRSLVLAVIAICLM